jgi:hypothetical protein
MKRLVTIMSASLVALAISGGVWAAESDKIEPAWIGAAHTRADHEALAKKYEAEAESFDKTAAMHEDLAETYGQPGLKETQAAQAKHCAKVASSLKTAAKEERALAAAHHKMAEAAPQ